MKRRLPAWHLAQALTQSRGVTLLELLLVVFIIALASAGVSLSLPDSRAAQLEREADRLAALLDAGRAASRASGVPVIWRPTEQGFAFDGLPPQTLPETWLAPGFTQPSAEPVVLGPEPIMPAQRVRLSAILGGEGRPRTVMVASDGLRPFVVMSGPAP